jgi:tetratricopeptide (TPR) repeat protein
MGNVDLSPEPESTEIVAGPAPAPGTPESTTGVDLAEDGEPWLDLLDLWDQEFRLGRDLTPESLCGGQTDWVEPLRRRIERQKRLYAVLDPGHSTAIESLPSFPGYETLAEIGRGGMGVVYKAQDTRLGRVVAIKTIAGASHAGSRHLERFLREARAVAKLRHPHIIPIHAIGEHEGRPYFVLEFARGGNLAQRLATSLLAPRAAAELVETLAGAVQHAHDLGLLHRDIKPSNVFLAADEVPMLGDFGLAKLREGDSTLTESGQLLGTPSYMAPEAALGQARRVGPAADVYALGAILYQCLVGRPPFLGATTLETLRQVVTTDVTPLRAVRPEIPLDLETITLKCLEKEPRRRYASAADLARDLRCFLEGRPIAARRASLAERSVRWCRRNPWIAAAGAILVLGASMSAWQAFRATRAQRAAALASRSYKAERDRAEAERNRAQRSRDNALRAVQNLLDTKGMPVITEEMKGYRRQLLAAAVDLLTDLLAQLEADPKGESLRVGTYIALAKVQSESGKREEARASADKAVALAEALARRDPSSTRFLRDLASAYQEFAIVLGPAEPAASRDAVTRSIAVWERSLIRGHEDDADLLKFQAMNQYNLGVIHFYRGAAETASDAPETRQALAALERADEALARALKVGKDRDALLFEAARLHNLMVPVNGRLDQVDAAARMGRKAIREFQELADRRPDDFMTVNLLSGAQRELGYFFTQAERPDEAIAYNLAARATLRKMIRKFEDSVSLSVELQAQLAVVESNLIDAYALDRPRHLPEIHDLTAEVLDLTRKLLLVVPRSREIRFVHAEMTRKTAYHRTLDGSPPDLASYAGAEGLWDELLGGSSSDQIGQLSRGNLVITRLRMADALSDQAKPDEAGRYLSLALEAAGRQPDVEYQVATSFADDARLEEELAANGRRGILEDMQRRSLGHAALMLGRAVDDGYRDIGALEKDRVLAPVLSRPEFAPIVNRLRDSLFPGDPFAKP